MRNLLLRKISEHRCHNYINMMAKKHRSSTKDELHPLFANGITGTLIQKKTDLDIHCFRSGPLGGIKQLEQ